LLTLDPFAKETAARIGTIEGFSDDYEQNCTPWLAAILKQWFTGVTPPRRSYYMAATATATATAKKKLDFDPRKYLATISEGRKVLAVPKKQTIFAQGAPADSVFFIQEGRVRLTVVSKVGKEATLGMLSEGAFF